MEGGSIMSVNKNARRANKAIYVKKHKICIYPPFEILLGQAKSTINNQLINDRYSLKLPPNKIKVLKG